MTAPRCHNRAPFTDPSAGWVDTGRLRLARPVADWRSRAVKMRQRPIYRYRWPWFTDRCATHDGKGIGPNGESYPEAHGWLPWCATCRWAP